MAWTEEFTTKSLMRRKNPFEVVRDRQLLAMARKGNLNPTDRKVFVKFMRARFPKEFCTGYLGEWVNRFKSGSPEAYMDLQSLALYRKIKGRRQ